jgi:hypothetical protein
MSPPFCARRCFGLEESRDQDTEIRILREKRELTQTARISTRWEFDWGLFSVCKEAAWYNLPDLPRVHRCSNQCSSRQPLSLLFSLAEQQEQDFEALTLRHDASMSCISNARVQRKNEAICVCLGEIAAFYGLVPPLTNDAHDRPNGYVNR